jgi:hypothetical protein
VRRGFNAPQATEAELNLDEIPKASLFEPRLAERGEDLVMARAQMSHLYRSSHTHAHTHSKHPQGKRLTAIMKRRSRSGALARE